MRSAEVDAGAGAGTFEFCLRLRGDEQGLDLHSIKKLSWGLSGLGEALQPHGSICFKKKIVNVLFVPALDTDNGYCALIPPHYHLGGNGYRVYIMYSCT
jgi:hypothetical protein